MSEIFTQDELKNLLEKQGAECGYVSIYMPTAKVGTDVQQGTARLKALIKQARERFVERGVRGPDADKVLAPAVSLVENTSFWQKQNEGLAMYIADDFFKYYRLPYSFREVVSVTDRFLLKPLLPMMSSDGRFYLLAISQDEVRLLQCTHYGFKKIPLPPTTPPNLTEALAYDHLDRELQFHWHQGAPGVQTGPVTGHGRTLEELKKMYVFRYFQEINKGVREVLKEETAPLVLAGVDYLLPLYHEANSYNNIVEQGITGNPQEEKVLTGDLHKRAWNIVQPMFERSKNTAVNATFQLIGNRSPRSSDDIKQIVIDSRYGRIDTLLFAQTGEIWGTIRDENKVMIHDRPEPCDYDLIDFAAAQTIINRGTAYPLEPENMPEGAALAAVFRY